MTPAADDAFGEHRGTSLAPTTASLRQRAGVWASTLVDRCTSRHALPALDGLRAVATSLVFIVHYQAAFGPLLAAHSGLHRAADYAADVGYHGVSIFFVLSGFLIYGSLVGRPVSFSQFFRRRAERIYPTYLVVLVLYLVLGTFVHSRSKLPDDGLAGYLAANVVLLPGVFRIQPIITVAWSLSYEVFFYLGLGIVVSVLQFRSWRRRYRLALLAALALIWLCGGPAVQETVRSFIIFLPGLMIWELWAARRVRLAAQRDLPERNLPRPGGWWIFAIFAILLSFVPAVGTYALTERLTAVGLAPSTMAFALLVVATVPLFWHALVGRWAAVTAVLASRPLRFLGGISYSFYLIHGLTINGIAFALAPLLRRVGAAGGPVVYALLVVPTFVAAVLVATVLFRQVEQRFSL